MFFTYFKTAFRTFAHHKQYVVLNVMGLSVGLCAAMLIALFAAFELSVDNAHPHAAHTYRLHVDVNVVGLEEIPLSTVHVAQTLVTRGDVEDVFYLTDVVDQALMSAHIRIGDNRLTLRNVYGASSNITDFVALDILYGDIKKALTEPDLMALSASEAKRLFGRENAVGGRLTSAGRDFTIAAVFQDIQENSHFLFHSLIGLDYVTHNEIASYIYVRVAELANLTAIEQHLSKTLIDYYGLKNSKLAYHLVPLDNVYFKAHSPFEQKPGGSWLLVILSLILSGLLVIIALANYTNMSTAQLLYRTKEVAVRKVLGAQKRQLITQFLCETICIVAMSMLLAMCMVELTLPIFGEFTQRPLALQFTLVRGLWILCIVVGLGVIAGIYPALLVVNAPQRLLLSGALRSGRSAILIRKILLTFQAAMAMGLIICTVFCLQQLSLLQSLHTGYQVDGRVVVHGLNSDKMMEKEHAILAQIRQLSGVEQATTTDSDLTRSIMGEYYFRWPNGYEETGLPPTIGTGFHPVQTFGLALLAGRDFTPTHQSDWLHEREDEGVTTKSMAILVTEQMANRAGYQDLDAVVGLTVTGLYSNTNATIVGVVADIKIGSAKDAWVPLSFSCGYSSQASVDLVIRTRQVNLPVLYHELSTLLNAFDLASEPQYSLMKADYQSNYRVEQDMIVLTSRFAILAVILSCIGVYGLTSYAAMRRQKEMAMRKVLGASRLNVVNLLAKEFLAVMAIATLFAWPISYFIINDWLGEFNERIEQSGWVYLMASGVVALITWLTVLLLGLKVANTRPSSILRDE